MTVLCSATVSQGIAIALKDCAASQDVLRDKAEAVELMKEVMTQISVAPQYREQIATLTFVQECLMTVRALLLGWDTAPWKLLQAPLPRMAELESGTMWEIKHPSRARFHEEVKASIQFMESHALTLHGEPWDWLLRFLHTLDYNLL